MGGLGWAVETPVLSPNVSGRDSKVPDSLLARRGVESTARLEKRRVSAVRQGNESVVASGREWAFERDGSK